MKTGSSYLVDRLISQYSDEELGLALFFTENSLEFSIYDIKNRHVLAMCSIPVFYTYGISKTLAILFSTEPLLDFDYKEVRVSFEQFKATLIPQDYFNAKDIQDYLPLVYEMDYSKETALNDFCLPAKANIVHSVDRQVAKAVAARYPNARFYSAYGVLIPAFFKLKQDDKRYQTQVFVNFRKDEFDIVVFDKHALLFINTFKYKTKEELLYFFLYVLNKLNIDMGNVYLRITGHGSEECISLMDAQVFSTQLVEDIQGLSSNISLNVQDDFLLLNLILCE